MNGKLRFSPQVTAVIVLVWLAGLMGYYFVGLGKRGLLQAGIVLFRDSFRLLDFSFAFWSLCGDRLLDLAATALLLVSAWCVGLAMLRGLRLVDRLDTLVHLFAVAVGLGLWAWFVLLAGLAGSISPTLYLAPTLLSLLLIAWHWPSLTKQWQEYRARPRERLGGFQIFLIACLALGFILHLIPAFSPEVEYDTLEYHLGALKEYQKAGRVYFLPHNFYASMPSLTEMLYLWSITLRSSTVAKLIHGSFALLTAIGLISFGSRLHSRQLGLIAAALYYLLPYVTNLADTARIDLATTFFAFLAGTALHQHLYDNRRQFLWLAALLVGLTMATKYTAAPIVLLPLTIVLVARQISAVRNRDLRCNDRYSQDAHSLSLILGFIALALVPVVPWLIKNAAFTGNPVYPIANGIFQSPYWDQTCAARFHRHHAPSFDSVSDWASFFTAAWVNSTTASFSSPILLLFAPLFTLVRKPEPRWKFCAWLGVLIYVCWWAFTFRPWRFLFPALPWFCLLGAMAAVVMEKERAVSLLLRVSLGIMLLFNLNYSFLLSAIDLNDADRFPPQMSKLAVFFGRVTPAEYLGNVYFTLGWMAKNLPPDACVLYVGEARTYYTPHRVLANTVYDRSIVGEMVARAKTPADLLQEMTNAGVTHVYINQDELDRLGRNYKYLKDMNWALFNEFLTKHTRVFFKNNAHTVYEIQKTERRTEAAHTAQPNP